jgi:hypothetical protein
MKRLWIFLFLPFLIAGAPEKSTTFVTGTTIRAKEVNKDFDDLYGYLQTGVDTLRSDAVDVITEIKSTVKTGSDQTVVTGTKGSDTQMCVWNSDGDSVALTTLTGNTTGVGVSGGFVVDSLTSCTSLSTDASGQFICN